MKMRSQTRNAWMNNIGGKLKWQTKQSLICLDFYIITEKQEISKAKLGFTVLQPGETEMSSGMVLSNGRRSPHPPHSPCVASLHSGRCHRSDILATVSYKEKTTSFFFFFSAPLLCIETHVIKTDFRLLKVDKSKGRTCTVANTFGYYSELEAHNQWDDLQDPVLSLQFQFHYVIVR